ncbi:MAG TPA: fatty acyl-AMP ligase [Xanthobacteraceae bacterium]|nr:fatty acyl-AMP ligase [Xanthobacteraceae bacterium]
MNANGRPAEASLNSLVDLLHRRAAEQPEDRAYVFLSDRGAEEASLTFAELDRRARAVAARLAAPGKAGERALLVFPPGLEFIVGFFGCLIAGIIAVPMMAPRRGGSRDGSAAIISDSRPRFALTSPALLAARPDVIERYRELGMEWVVVDPADDAAPPPVVLAAPGRDDVAFLQYTSGSTSAPKGVVVTHGNLLANLEMICVSLGNTRRSTYANWVPLFHDLGLIANVLQSLYLGTLCVMMSPVAFLQRPLAWLRAISHYRVDASGGPNFAFDLCVARFKPEQLEGVDLSCWHMAFSAAEPVRAETMQRFAATFAPYGFDPKALYVGYGLAEATLIVTAGRRGQGPVTRTVSRDALLHGKALPPLAPADTQVAVSCGRAGAGGRVAIVEPRTCRRLGPNIVGEVWVAGPHVAQGYWHNPAATDATFRARIADEGDAPWLRTGDLGFLDEDGELYITGRIKDVIIIRGMNHYPQDIEDTVQNSHPALRRNCGAAFIIGEEGGGEQLIVVQEVERTFRNKVADEDFVGTIREAVADEHEIAVHKVVLIRPGAIPKTTSGKVQRNLTRQLWLEGTLEVLE